MGGQLGYLEAGQHRCLKWDQKQCRFASHVMLHLLPRSRPPSWPLSACRHSICMPCWRPAQLANTTASDTLMWAHEQHETACQGSRGWLVQLTQSVWCKPHTSSIAGGAWILVQHWPDAITFLLQVWEVQTEEVHILCKLRCLGCFALAAACGAGHRCWH